MPDHRCCNHNCEQGDMCPVRQRAAEAQAARHVGRDIDRRRGPTWFWFLFGWVIHGERRSGRDRRRRTEEMYDTGRTLHGLPIVIDDTVPPGKAEFRSGRRTVEADVKSTGEEE